VRAAVAILVVAGVVAGCGDPSKDDYKIEYDKASKEFKQSVDQAGQQVPKGASLKQRIPALVAFRNSVSRLSIKLDGFDPPKDVEKLNDQAVAGLRKLASDLGSFEQAAKANNRTAAAKITPKLQTDQAQLQTVLDQIDQKLSE
jgi:hypothetical protein